MKLKQLHEAKERSVINVMGDPGHYVYNFDCSDKMLTSLAGSPMKAENFKCSKNRLTSLTAGPKTVFSKFDCSDNHLTSLRGGPIYVGGDYSCSRNAMMTTLEGCPSEIGGRLLCSGVPLASFEGFPSIINGGVWACECNLTSLQGVHKHIKVIDGEFNLLRNNGLENDLLGLILIQGITKVRLDNTRLEGILNKYLGAENKKRAMLQCQQELIEEGCEGAAQL